MKPAPFRYHRTNSVADVVDLLGAFGDDEVKLIAGGQSLIPLMNFRLARPDHLIDISAVPELLRVERTADGIDIGAMVRQRDLVVDSLLRYELPLMAEAVAHVGHGHIRNRGTLGGSLAHADPAAELPSS